MPGTGSSSTPLASARWRRPVAWALLAALQLAPPGVSLAAPAGEQVVAGEATFERAGDLTHITTRTPETIVNYSSFDIGSHETVRIDQPDAASRILNRVLSTDPTLVEGRLFSNGQVWIANPVGVFFGGQAVVDVGGLVAAAGQVADADFLAGSERFAALSGDVEIAPGALIRAGDRVLLVGERVANYGNIDVPEGMIAFAAGGEVHLARVDGRIMITADRVEAPDPERWAIEQAGTLDAERVSLTAGDAYSLAMNHSGITRAREIELEGGDGGLVEVSGLLDASSSAAGEGGGAIRVLGERVALQDATLDASGPAGGGEIRVGGDVQGGGELRTARRTYVSPDAVLRADARESGDGGSVVVWADEATAFHGELSARGKGQGGDGGFAEISGKQSLVAHGEVDLGADAGRAGTLLYDPLRIVIRGGTLDGADVETSDAFLRSDAGTPGAVAIGDLGDASDPFVIYESELEGTNANIVLAAGRSIQSEGSFAGDEVAITAGRDLSMSVDDAGGTVAPGELVGIDIRTHDGAGDLTWSLSDGGKLALSTESSGDHSADILVGSVVTRGVRAGAGNSVSIAATERGDIEIGSIRTSGADRAGDVEKTVFGVVVNTLDAGSVAVSTEEGAITVGSIEAVGGSATALPDGAGSGGDGGAVVVSASQGSLTLGSVDVSGGDGRVRLVDGAPDGAGGAAGSITLIADLDPQAVDAEPSDPDTHVLRVTGDLLAHGGQGLGTELVVTPPSGGNAGKTELFGASGGSGGQIFASAGYAADEGRIELGTAATPIAVDASGGDGTAAGGSTTSGGESAFSGAAIGAIRVEAHGDVTAHAVLAARGGDAGTQGGVDAGPGGFGGLGGGVSVGSDAGNVQLNETGAPALVATDGGRGRIEPAQALRDGVVRFNGQGGGAGAFTAESAGDGGALEVLGAVSARGGEGNSGAGGAGGNVTLTALDGAITVAGVDASGGNGSGSFDEAAGALVPQGAGGGNGGNIAVTTQAGTETTSVGGGDLLLAGNLTSAGGSGEPDPDGDIADPNENNGLGGTVRLSSVKDVAAAGSFAPTLRAGTVEVTGQNVFAGGGPDLLLTSTGANAPADSVARAGVAAQGDARVLLDDDADLFDRFELIQRDATGDVSVLRDDAATVIAAGGGSAGSPLHTLDEIDTEGLPLHFTYRLADQAISPGSPGGVEQIDARTLAVESDAVRFGAAGGKLANARADAAFPEGERLLGHVEGIGAGPHVTSSGNVELVATNVGSDTTAFHVAGVDPGGAAPFVEVSVAGDVDLAVSGDVAAVDLTQRRTLGDASVALPGGGAVSIAGSVVDTGASRVETSRVTGVDTTASGIGFFYHLADTTASSSDADRGEPTLQIASSAVELGGSGGFASTGDIVLEGGAGPAVDAGGNSVLLIADANLDGAGALVASGSGAADVADAGALVAIGGEGVGSEAAPLRVSGAASGLALAGSGGSGDFRVENQAGAGPIRIEPIALSAAHAGATEEHTLRGVHAGGDVVIENGGGVIVLGAIQPVADDELFNVSGRPGLVIGGSASGSDRRYGFGDLRIASSRLVAASPDTTAPHVTSGGSQRFGGALELANPTTLETARNDPFAGPLDAGSTLNAVRLVAGGDVSIEGDVDTPGSLPAADHTQLVVDADGVVELGGDVGSNAGGAATLDSFVVGGSRLTAGAHAVNVGSADFRGAIDGPGSLSVRGLGSGSRLTFRGNVGGGAPLAAFDADAERLVFSGADQVVAGEIALNAATPPSGVPDTATISDNSGGLALHSTGVLGSTGNLMIGAREKLSVNGPLTISAKGTATVGDLSASSIRVDASRIVIQGRNPGNVALAGGGLLRDRGVDWAANEIATNVQPEWDGVGTPPTMVLGSGGVRLGAGPSPFDLIRFDERLDEITIASFDGGDPLLDLTGTGPRLVSDASGDLPREAAPVMAALAARASETPPAPPPELSAEQVIGYVRCRTPEGEPCGDAAAPADSALATERAREIVSRYHELIASPRGSERLALAFEPVAADGGAALLDGRILYRQLAAAEDLAGARAAVRELARVLAEISLLGLEAPRADGVRRAVAADFAAATRLPGFEADAALDAAAESGVGALP